MRQPEEAAGLAVNFFRKVQVGDPLGSVFVEGIVWSKDGDEGWDVTLSYTIRTAGSVFELSGVPPPRRRSVVQIDRDGAFKGMTALPA